jgi:hypothetical protein
MVFFGKFDKPLFEIAVLVGVRVFYGMLAVQFFRAHILSQRQGRGRKMVHLDIHHHRKEQRHKGRYKKKEPIPAARLFPPFNHPFFSAPAE